MKCPNCSHVNAEHAKFCEACGTNLQQVQAETPKPNEKAAAADAFANAPAEDAQDNLQTGQSSEGKSETREPARQDAPVTAHDETKRFESLPYEAAEKADEGKEAAGRPEDSGEKNKKARDEDEDKHPGEADDPAAEAGAYHAVPPAAVSALPPQNTERPQGAAARPEQMNQPIPPAAETAGRKTAPPKAQMPPPPQGSPQQGRPFPPQQRQMPPQDRGRGPQAPPVQGQAPGRPFPPQGQPQAPGVPPQGRGPGGPMQPGPAAAPQGPGPQQRRQAPPPPGAGGPGQRQPMAKGTLPPYAQNVQGVKGPAAPGMAAGPGPQGAVPPPAGDKKKAKAKGEGKKKSPAVIVLIIVAAAALLALGVFLLVHFVFGSGNAPEMDNETLLQIARENENSILDMWSEVPFVEAELRKSESYKDSKIRVYVFYADMVRENEDMRIEAPYSFNMTWNKSDKSWNLIYGGPEEDPKLIPKTTVSEEEIFDQLEWFSIVDEDGKTWYLEDDIVTSKEILSREMNDSHTREEISLKVIAESDITELHAEIKMAFDWSYGDWYYDYDAEEVLSSELVYKEGAEFTFTEEDVYALWSGEVLSLNPYAGEDIPVNLSFPEDASEIITAVDIKDISSGFDETEKVVSYTFDISLDDWFAGTVMADENFVYDSEDEVYYLEDSYSYYDFECTKSDLTGFWYADYLTDNGNYELYMSIVPEEGQEDVFSAQILVSSEAEGFEDGLYTAIIDADREAYYINFTAGDWLVESESFNRMSFSGYLNPEYEEINWTSGYTLEMVRISRDPNYGAEDEPEVSDETKASEESGSGETTESSKAA